MQDLLHYCISRLTSLTTKFFEKLVRKLFRIILLLLGPHPRELSFEVRTIERRKFLHALIEQFQGILTGSYSPIGKNLRSLYIVNRIAFTEIIHLPITLIPPLAIEHKEYTSKFFKRNLLARSFGSQTMSFKGRVFTVLIKLAVASNQTRLEQYGFEFPAPKFISLNIAAHSTLFSAGCIGRYTLSFQEITLLILIKRDDAHADFLDR